MDNEVTKQPENIEPTFEEKLARLLNAHCKENISNTPDFVLARFMLSCLDAFNVATNARTKWFSD